MTDESLLEEIVPRKTIKPPKPERFVRKDIGSTKGKSSKYLKEVTIPHLQTRIYNLKIELEKARAGRQRTRDSKKQALKKTKDRIWNKQKKAYAVTQGKLNDRAKEWFYDKVKVQRLTSSTYMDGLTAYPIIQQYARAEGINYKKLGLFVLINHFNWFQLKDSAYYGYSYNFTSVIVRGLVADGLVEKFIGKSNSYCVTLKGQKKFLSFQTYYTQKTRELFKMWDSKFTNRTGGTSVKLKHRFISKVKDIYNED